MPSYNLAETIYNKWLHPSSNQGNDLYVATVDDFVRALIQVSMYYQYLKGEHLRICSRKEELILWIVQHLALRFGNPKALNIAMTKMPRIEEFCTWNPYIEGEEVFGSQKCKADIPLGFEYKSHRPDQVNFSRPRIRTRSIAAGGASCSLNEILEEPFPNLQEHPIPIDNNRTTHVTAIQETAYKKTKWHIAKLPKSSAKAFFAQQSITKKKCKAKIFQGNRATAAPKYTGIMVHYKKKKEEVMQFFFYNDNIK